MLACTPRLRFAKLAGWWLERYERKVAAGQRRERTLALHRYHLGRHLLPSLGASLARAITVTDVANLIERLRSEGRSERTIQSAPAHPEQHHALRDPQHLDRREPA